MTTQIKNQGMSKEERETRQLLAQKRDEAQQFINLGKTEDAKQCLKEAKTLKDKVETFEEIRNMNVSYNEPEEKTVQNSVVVPNDIQNNASHKSADLFLNAVKTGDPTPIKNAVQEGAMVEGIDEDGGLIVPEDISTKIIQKRRQFDSLAELVNIVPVSTNKGARTYEKLSDITPLVNLDETDAIEKMNAMKFERLIYNIKNYAGLMVLSNDLLNDTKEALLSFLTDFLAKKSAVTRNTLILGVLNDLTKKTISDVDGIKDIINVDLDPAISATSAFVTNQSGFNALDKVKDAFGHYLLQPDPINKTHKLLFDKPVRVISNKYLPNGGTKTNPKFPLIIGDLKEAITLFDRQKYSIAFTNVGAGAFETNTTKIRVIEREDVKLADDGAVVFAEFAAIKDETPVETLTTA
ncbi:phage major capsid protein [Bacillus velezensis]|uniref:phage major capsid protein n=1 Tax=Bacillus velezensis TaxID=492670 RepID=UPI002DB9F2F2|nr:phage major capsid protein [Bacillus velezensis]MEC0405732.1 phage major capsid protein [Bacillus velezensis]